MTTEEKLQEFMKEISWMVEMENTLNQRIIAKVFYGNILRHHELFKSVLREHSGGNCYHIFFLTNDNRILEYNELTGLTLLSGSRGWKSPEQYYEYGWDVMEGIEKDGIKGHGYEDEVDDVVIIKILEECDSLEEYKEEVDKLFRAIYASQGKEMPVKKNLPVEVYSEYIRMVHNTPLFTCFDFTNTHDIT